MNGKIAKKLQALSQCSGISYKDLKRMYLANTLEAYLMKVKEQAELKELTDKIEYDLLTTGKSIITGTYEAIPDTALIRNGVLTYTK